MLFEQGDLFSSERILKADCICVTTNGIRKANGLATMGAGVAKAAAEKWPVLPYNLGRLLEKNGNITQVMGYAKARNQEEERGPALVAFPTKHHWKQPSDLELIERSAKQLKELTNKHGWSRVFLSPPGCGLGGLSFNQVSPVLGLHFDDRFVIVSFKKLV